MNKLAFSIMENNEKLDAKDLSDTKKEEDVKSAIASSHILPQDNTYEASATAASNSCRDSQEATKMNDQAKIALVFISRFC